MTPGIATLSEDGRDLLVVVSDGITRTQRDIAFGLYGPGHGGVRRVQEAAQELRLAGWPLVSDGEGMRLADDPVVVRACADALRRRAITQLLTARALRQTAHRMAQPLQLWEAAS